MRKVIPALTGLAQLHNLITLARENKEEGSGQEAGEVRINGKFSLNAKRPVCVYVCVLSNSQEVASFPFKEACSL